MRKPIPPGMSISQGFVGEGKNVVEVMGESDSVLLEDEHTESQVRVSRRYLPRLIRMLEFEATRPVERPVTGWRPPQQLFTFDIEMKKGRKRKRKVTK
jgi:hypothetical protein